MHVAARLPLNRYSLDRHVNYQVRVLTVILLAVLSFAGALAAPDGVISQGDTVEVQATPEDQFPLHTPRPLTAAVREVLMNPDSAAVCLVEGRPQYSKDGSRRLRSGEAPAQYAAGYPVVSDWRALDADETAKLSALLLSVDGYGRRGTFACIYAPLEVVRLFHEGAVLEIRLCHCTSNATLELAGTQCGLYTELINVELLEIVAGVFPEDDRVLGELESWRSHPFYGAQR